MNVTYNTGALAVSELGGTALSHRGQVWGLSAFRKLKAGPQLNLAESP